MKRTRIKQIWANASEFENAEITVAGWAKSIRDMKEFAFVTLNDGSTFNDLQVVLSQGDLANYQDVTHAGTGAALVCTGNIKLTPDAPQPFELAASAVKIEGTSGPDYPLQKKRATPEYLRTIQHLRPRTNLFRAVFRVRSTAAHAIHTFFQERGFLYVHTPIITASDCEGAGEMFTVTTLDPTAGDEFNRPLGEEIADLQAVDGESKSSAQETTQVKDPAVEKVDGEDKCSSQKIPQNYDNDFFGKHASLTVSGQLNAENFALAFGDVYTFGPTFRAEDSNTPRHAAEFWMIEPEMAFADLADDMDVAEDMLKFVIDYVLGHCKPELNMLNKFVDKGLLDRLNSVAKADFVRVTYTDAIKILEDAEANNKVKFEYPVSWGVDLQTEHERYLTEQHYKCPVFVYDYPAEIKAFYMRMNDDGKTVAAADCLVPQIGEIIGGSQREERLELLEQRIVDLGMEPEQYKYYLDLRRFGSCTHSGFGLGFERLIMYLTGVSNIRDVLPHPRTVGNAEF